MRLNNIAFIMGATLLYHFNVSTQEIRGGNELEHSFADKFETKLQFQLRNSLENNIYTVDQGITQIDIEYNPLINLGISGTYRYTSEIKRDIEKVEFNDIEDKHRITVDISYKTKNLLKDAKVSNRLRYQFSFKEGDTENYYLRNKLKCEYKLTKKVLPYAAIEPFYLIDRKSINALRLYFGSEFELLKNNIDMYIISELSKKNDKFGSHYIMGFSYKL